MNIEVRKKQIIRKIKEVQGEKLLELIDAVLNRNPIVAYTIDGKSLTSVEYSKHIESISNAVADGAETYTSEQVRTSILERKKLILKK
ncbi:hypothetical protein SLW70_06730 [Flavobacterium sp. NG2]|uniref:hypothetical protein n=1 Tax=Flavobacterium sp. NG2 TaxID=3097547 RepID=UPI002A81DCF9|nr:hypothetical protein [Flavobacterium sp. NG2]WPR72816.1 hypothetical protein SLW70_06730 [Flavobacterium sp. NG2]